MPLLLSIPFVSSEPDVTFAALEPINKLQINVGAASHAARDLGDPGAMRWRYYASHDSTTERDGDKSGSR